MPWCEDCAKYWAPSAMSSDGTCPTCHRSLDAHTAKSDRPDSSESSERTPITAKNVDLHRLAAGEDGDADDMKAPWHFKLLMVLLALYLGWRIVQLFA